MEIAIQTVSSMVELIRLRLLKDGGSSFG